VGPAIRPEAGSELAVIAISKEKMMRKLAATLAAALALVGVGLAAHTATSNSGGGFVDASAQTGSILFYNLPYIEQDNLFRAFN
jgi:multisubunit Na+/H+ antiporter MnhB subunit